jgi:carboxymethylenebutenolidase
MNSPTLTNIQVTPELGGLLAVPQGAGPWPAVVMVHEVFGIDDVASAKAVLTARPDVTDKVGVIGFCMGGGFALLLANKGYDAANANYGMLPKDMDEALAGACPILGNYGGKDGQLKDAKTKLDETLTKLDVVHDIKVYPESGHAFMNPKQGGGPIMGSLLRITGAKPNPADAQDAWLRIEKFFTEHLSA